MTTYKNFRNALMTLLGAVMFCFTACKEDTLKSDACEIVSFTVNGEAWTIDGTDITKTFPTGTAVTNFTPTITVSAGATVSPASGVAQNFSLADGVVYTVTAADGTTKKTYTAKATVAASTEAEILSFTVNGEDWTIDGTDITHAYPARPDVTALAPTITVSKGATVRPASGVAQDFSSADGVIYTVTAADGTTTKTYTVKATVEPLEVTLSSTDLVPAIGGEIKATVKAEGDWAVSTSESWIHLTPIRGTGNGEFTIRVYDHDAQTERAATVTVSIDDTDIKKEITITQDRVQAAFTLTDQGVFANKCVGVWYFWSNFAEPPAPSPALYYKYTVLKRGHLNIKFTNSHIHTFMMNREPGYNKNLGLNDDGSPTFSAQPTVPMDENLDNNAYSAVISADKDGKNGDVRAICPRDTPQDITFYLEPGIYWTTHTLEVNTDAPDCAIEGMPMYGYDEVFNLTVTFTPDPDASE